MCFCIRGQQAGYACRCRDAQASRLVASAVALCLCACVSAVRWGLWLLEEPDQETMAKLRPYVVFC